MHLHSSTADVIHLQLLPNFRDTHDSGGTHKRAGSKSVHFHIIPRPIPGALK
jgi:hypothetical protein